MPQVTKIIDIENVGNTNHDVRSESDEEDQNTNLIMVGAAADYNPPKVNVISPEEGTLQDYLKKREEENSNAKLKKLQTEYGKKEAKRRSIMNLSSVLARKILPTLGLFFVLTYWSAGLLHYHRIHHLAILICELIFTVFYFTVVMFINYVF